MRRFSLLFLNFIICCSLFLPISILADGDEYNPEYNTYGLKIQDGNYFGVSKTIPYYLYRLYDNEDHSYYFVSNSSSLTILGSNTDSSVNSWVVFWGNFTQGGLAQAFYLYEDENTALTYGFAPISEIHETTVCQYSWGTDMNSSCIYTLPDDRISNIGYFWLRSVTGNNIISDPHVFGGTLNFMTCSSSGCTWASTVNLNFYGWQIERLQSFYPKQDLDYSKLTFILLSLIFSVQLFDFYRRKVD